MGACLEEKAKIVSKSGLKKEKKQKIKSERKNKLKYNSKSNRELEVLNEHKPVPLNIAIKVMKAICKIIIETKKGTLYGTGFFMNYSDSLKCLITNYHVINPSLENGNIEIEIHNKNKMKLKFNNRYIKYIERPRDITIIEIKETDEIYNDIEFLDYDNNYTKRGYIIYKDVDVFSIEHPNGKDAASASGIIINIYEFEFDHNIATDKGSSGCPIILLNNNINMIQVIGIHKEGDKKHKINGGTFIGEIFNNDLNKENKNNYIIAEINIKEEDINENIRIINSYEEFSRSNREIIDECENKDEYKNEDEIKKCEIKINNELIPFNYFYKFKSKGKYIIQYSFKNNINKTCYMFCGCSLTNINLSNFNANNVTNMECMFSGCSSLTNINLSNFNTNNVTNMGSMFFGCSSLTNINLSNFNTNNVTYMCSMFSRCSSLTNINLSNFNTNNVINMFSMFSYCSSLTNINLSNFNTNNVFNMERMFDGCSSLTSINLSNFNTNNVTNMECMFSGCSSLTKINLSNFNTNKVTDMEYMFSHCSSLTNINLSNFNTNNFTNMECMFFGCSSLKKENIITKDKRILNEF